MANGNGVKFSIYQWINITLLGIIIALMTYIWNDFTVRDKEWKKKQEEKIENIILESSFIKKHIQQTDNVDIDKAIHDYKWERMYEDWRKKGSNPRGLNLENQEKQYVKLK